MPICSDKELRVAIATGRIAAVTLDTSIFEQKKFRFTGPAIGALSALKPKPQSFVLSGTIAREVVGRHGEAMREASQALLTAAKRTVGLYNVRDPAPAYVRDLVTGGLSPADAAQQQFDAFIAEMDCEVIDDAALVETQTIYSAYFNKEPPFGSGKKKSEFPDALALFALEGHARDLGDDKGILVISDDSDWKAFCEASEFLYYTKALEPGLDLVAEAPQAVRHAVVDWLKDQVGRAAVHSALSGRVEMVDFSADAFATHGAVEAFAWEGMLKGIQWADEPDIDILAIEMIDDETLQVVISLSLVLDISVPVELSFSVYDSIDRDMVGMGGRTIDADHEAAGNATLTLLLYDLGTATQEVEIEETELNLNDTEVELGELSIFEPGDYEP